MNVCICACVRMQVFTITSILMAITRNVLITKGGKKSNEKSNCTKVLDMRELLKENNS